jgi:type I restriction enzyme R subunit
MSTFNFNEQSTSHVPALQLLCKLGYQYLTPAEALALRGGRQAEVILTDVLSDWLAEHNAYDYKGRTYNFSAGDIQQAVGALSRLAYDGLVTSNERAFDLIGQGKSFAQHVAGDTKSFSLQYVDWGHPENNVFHVTEEFVVAQRGAMGTRRPDIVLFVNGIPFGVIECKSPDIKKPVHKAIEQHGRNWRDEEIPQLYAHAQVALALAHNVAKYGTCGTEGKYWAVWKEDTPDFEARLTELLAQPLAEDVVGHLIQGVARRYQNHRADTLRKLTEPRLPTEQDRALLALCHPARLLKLARQYTLFDNGKKIIARYQQFFCVEKILNRIRERDAEGRRKGGVVWHTQGSGKSLTMVFLAKGIALLRQMPDHKIVLVTDRIDLDDQLHKTFRHCGREAEQASSGRRLVGMLQSKSARIIATTIGKFETVIEKFDLTIDNPDIFVLVDEGHRTQYGVMHANMRRVLPRACYISFTGTPVMKKDKDTVRRFGGLIDVYSITQAVEDEAVVPLLYEMRLPDQKVDEAGIDAWFERTTRDLTEKQVADLKAKYATTDQLNKTEQRIQAIAWDVSQHFQNNWQGTGFKGQLVAPDKASALRYQHYLAEFGMVTSEVLISGPDEREGDETYTSEKKLQVLKFWKKMMARFGSEKQYNEQIINHFKNAEEPEIIIVVDKLLTGFDAPRNVVLYLTRSLREHSLLQAIARVNRLYEGKDFGYVIDYYGVLGELDEAVDLYSSLEAFDAEDLRGTLRDVKAEIEKLPQAHSTLLDTFKTIANKHDLEAYERFLADEAVRDQFYRRLSAFSRTLSVALASAAFYEETDAAMIDRYKADLKFFFKLRASVRRRYAEVVDFSAYEPRIQKLLDTYVGTGEVEKLTPLVNIFDQDRFMQEVDAEESLGAKADMIAHRTLRTIYERMDEDPVFYERFSELIKRAIQAYREGVLQSAEYLRQVTGHMNAVLNRTGDDLPEALAGEDVAKAYYGIVNQQVTEALGEEKAAALAPALAETAIAIDRIIDDHRIVKWRDNVDVQNRMKMAIEDHLFEVQEALGIELDFDTIDRILDGTLEIAKVRKP